MSYVFYQRFTDSSTKAGRAYSVNTVYVGKCFLISPGISEYQQQEKMLKPPNIAISLPTDDSRVQVYIIRDDSENALILDYWHYPIKPLELKNNMFMGLSLTKEYHIRIPREDSPCNKIPEKSYYKVSCPKCYFIHHKLDLSDSASGRWWQMDTWNTPTHPALVWLVPAGFRKLIASFTKSELYLSVILSKNTSACWTDIETRGTRPRDNAWNHARRRTTRQYPAQMTRSHFRM